VKYYRQFCMAVCGCMQTKTFLNIYVKFRDDLKQWKRICH